MKLNKVQIVAIVGSVLGIAGTLVSGWASAKKMDDTITEKVAEALAANNQIEES